MSTTANKIRGLSATHMIIDEWDNVKRPNYILADYKMIRLGKKDYGFVLRVTGYGGVGARYKCSHIEAQRRFTALLIARRLTS